MARRGEKWEKVFEVLSRFPEGLNFNRLAREAKIKPPTLAYYIYGEKKGEKNYGGMFRDKVLVRKFGNVTVLSLKA